MIFLVEYDRDRGELVSIRAFDASNRENAEDVRLRRELDLKRNHVQHEVVLLEADSEQALRRTHRRYFEDLVELVSGVDRQAGHGVK